MPPHLKLLYVPFEPMTFTEKAPWEARRLDTSEDLIRTWLTTKAAKAAADAAHKQSEANLQHAREEGQLARFYDELSDSYMCPDVTFVRSERRTWPNECFSEDLQTRIAAEKETREPKITTSWRAVLKND